MSYVDEVYARVVEQNPGESEFHQAVKEVLDSLKLVIDANEEKYRKMGLLERYRTLQGRPSSASFSKPEHFKVPGL